MQKLKVYLTKQNKHNKSTIQKIKQKMLKSKSNLLGVDSHAHSTTHNNSQTQISKSNMMRNNQSTSVKKRMIAPNNGSKDQNRSLQNISQFKSEIKNLIKPPSRYDSIKEPQKKNSKILNDNKKNSKLTSSQTRLHYQSETKKQVERISNKIHKSQKNLDSILYKRSNQSQYQISDIELQFKAVLHQKFNQRGLLAPVTNKNSQNQKYPHKKRSKSANVEKKSKQQSKNQLDKRNNSYQKMSKKIQKTTFMNEKINEKIKKQKNLNQIETKSMFRTRKGIQVMNPNKVNQDRLYIKQSQQISNSKNISVYAVADGHGPNGHFVSHLIILQVYLKQNRTIKYSLEKCYSDIQSALLKNTDFNADFSGSTLVTVVIENNKKLICANAGDSRAIVARQLNKNNWQVIRLSNDHKPHLLEQKSRIIAQGGRVQTVYDQRGKSIGPLRVWLPKKQLQGLAMSRSLGDNISKPIGVTHQPEVLTHELTQEDKFILIASDGVWQFLSNYQILSLIIPYYKQNRLEDACQALMKEAYNSWTVQDNSVIDDITFILIFLSSDKNQTVEGGTQHEDSIPSMNVKKRKKEMEQSQNQKQKQAHEQKQVGPKKQRDAHISTQNRFKKEEH